MKKLRLIASVMLLSVCVDVHAQSSLPFGMNMLSRACRLDQVPTVMYLFGWVPLPRVASPGGTYYDSVIKTGQPLDARNYWSLESFTTYFLPLTNLPSVTTSKYWLRANSQSWSKRKTIMAHDIGDRYAGDPGLCDAGAGVAPSPAGGTTFNPNATLNGVSACAYPWIKYKQFDSGYQAKFAQSELPAGVDFVLWRARGGTGSYPYFFDIPFSASDTLYRAGPPVPGDDDYVTMTWTQADFWVVGTHYYQDGTSPMPVEVYVGKTTVMNDCQLDKWGGWFETP